GVFDSDPGQNGHSSGPALRSAGFWTNVTGRAPRPAATITSCPLNGSWRSSDIAIRLRGSVVQALAAWAPKFVPHAESGDPGWWPRGQYLRDRRRHAGGRRHAG